MTTEQHGSKTEGRGEVPFFVCARCGNTYFSYASKVENGVLVLDKSRVICGSCREASPAPSPQSLPELGRGDDLARQERMVELEREIAEAEQYIQDIELDGFSPASGTATKLAQLRAELSRLRNEGGGEAVARDIDDDRYLAGYSDGQRDCTEEARHRCSPDWMNALIMLVFYTDQPYHLRPADYDQRLTKCWDDACRLYNSKPGELTSPSDFPACEAIEPTDAQVEAACVAWSATWGHEFPASLMGSDIHDHAADCVRSTMRNALRAAALQPLSQGNGEAVASDNEVAEIERLAQSHSVLHWPTLLRVIERLRKAEAASQPEGVREALAELLQRAWPIDTGLSRIGKAESDQRLVTPDANISVRELRRLMKAISKLANTITTTPFRGLVEAAEWQRSGIYIASKCKHADRWRLLRDTIGLPIKSTWIDEAGEGETSDFADLWRRNISEACSAEVLIINRERDEVLKGAWIEMGAALACGVPVYAVGIEEFAIAKANGVTHFRHIRDAVDAAKKLVFRTLSAKPTATAADREGDRDA